MVKGQPHFRKNPIIAYIFSYFQGLGMDLGLASLHQDWTKDDYAQLYQLLGVQVEGQRFASYMSEEIWEEVAAMVEELEAEA